MVAAAWSARLARITPASLTLLISACEPCTNDVLASTVSDDASRTAVAYNRDCGATTGFNTQVAVELGPDAAPSGGNTVFVVDDGHDSTIRSFRHGGPVVQMTWSGLRELEIRYDARVRVFKQESQRNGVRIRYVRWSERAPAGEPVAAPDNAR